MQTTIVDHPLVASRLTVMRDGRTTDGAFRAALRELSMMVVYEALRAAPVRIVEVETPLAITKGVELQEPPLLVPVLRAGLGMAEAAHALVPEAAMGFVGLARDETTHQPMAYLESLPERLDDRPVMVLDPMIATGGSLLHCCRLLVDRGARRITVASVLAAPEGLAALEASGVDLEVYTASVDERLNGDAYIVPGLGDAGDRQFGAV